MTDQKNDIEYFETVMQIIEDNPQIKKLKNYKQHKITNTYNHCDSVARCSFFLANRLGWDIDERSLARGAMLHDYYLYDIKASGLSDYSHGIHHPVTALKNAQEIFGLNEKEKNIIVSHMWPLTLTRLPRTREAVLVCMADKIVAFMEMCLRRQYNCK